jgi:NADPH-dependent 2,4-dienoyl-CoA reductase/sulfur reductase-like enzyme
VGNIIIKDCIGNARAGFEGERIIKKTTSPTKEMVVGAGVAGLEAAITARQAGHRVEIYEKTGDIGGQIWIAAAPPISRSCLNLSGITGPWLKNMRFQSIFRPLTEPRIKVYGLPGRC